MAIANALDGMSRERAAERAGMQAMLDELAKAVEQDAHAVVIMDRTGWLALRQGSHGTRQHQLGLPATLPTGLIWAVCVDGVFDTIRRYGMPARNGSLCSGRLMRCWLGIMLLVRDLTSPLLSISRLEVAAGECVAIRGASGAGKSLLLRSIADLDPNEGEVSLDDRSRRAMSACLWRREVMLVPAEAGWWADTVRDHFLAKQPAGELIASLGLPSEALEWNVARLSTGERHRLAIARALSFSPRAMLLDEPTAALDAMAAERLEVVLRKRLAEGMHLLLVTHDKDQAARMAARTIIMANGRIAEVTGPSA